MTAQSSDSFIFKGESFSIIGIEGNGLFSPEQFGMTPCMISTACYRGFYAVYKLTETALFLLELTIRTEDGKYLPINDNVPIIDNKHYQATYHNLDIQVPFSGKIRLAKDFIEEFYVHMGYQKPSAYKTVYDVTLEKGQVINLNDRSKELEKMRGAFKKSYEAGNNTIAEAFDLNMDLK